MKNDSKELNQINNSIQELGANLYQRLRALSALLKIISESLSESNAAAKAYAIVQTVLMLESINYEVASEISRLMIEVDACNIFPTVKENRVPRQTIIDATELAEDILADLPIGYRVVQDACKRDEIASENLASSEVVITGCIPYMRNILTKKNDHMAVADILFEDKTSTEIVIFPKTLARYRDIIDTIRKTGAIRNFVCDFDGESNILKEIRYTDDIEQVFAGLNRNGDFFSIANEDEFKQWLFEQNDNLIAPQEATIKPEFVLGQRVILTKTILDTTTDIHPIHHYEGDEGTVVAVGGTSTTFGFQSDRYDGITSMGRDVDGEFRQVLDFCIPATAKTGSDS